MEKENYFLCKVVKELKGDDLNKEESVIKEYMKGCLTETFVISNFEIKNDKAIAICVCSSEEDYDYILARTSYDIQKINK